MSQRIEVSKSVFKTWKTLAELSKETGFSETALLGALQRLGCERRPLERDGKTLGRRPFVYRVKS